MINISLQVYLLNKITLCSPDKVRFREICKNIYETKIGMGDLASSVFFSLTQAEYAAGNFRNKILEGQMTAAVRVGSRTDNVAGVKLPVFSQRETGVDVNKDNLGLTGESFNRSLKSPTIKMKWFSTLIVL